MTIQNLYFGKDDAETDFTGSGLLQGSFLKTSIYEQVKSRSKSLVIGRKGSGKSALCLMLKKELSKESKTYACVITPDAISADEIRRFQITGINEQQSKKLIWRYIFLVQICKFLLEVSRDKHGNDVDWSTEPEQQPSSDWGTPENCSLQLRKIREFLVENREVDDLNFQENFWRIINRIQTALSFKAFGQSIELKSGQAPNEGLDFSSKLEFLESYLKKPLEALNEYQLFLLVDKVDEIWDGNPSSNEMATGLLMASKEINQVCNNVSSTIFLRTDIYEQLQFFDKDKLRGDEVLVLWDSETLPEIILERARASTKQTEMSQEDFWSKYFPSRIEEISTPEFMVSHTLMRPRDLIQLCNLCVDIARRESFNPVQPKHVQQALNMYSSWNLNDLLGEYRVNYPFLNDLLLLFSNTSYAIPRSRFEDTFNRLKVAFEERYPAYSNLLGIDSVLNILYGIGFIGVERSAKVVFYYQDLQNLRTIEDSDRVFVVHPAFRNALRCTSSIDIQPYSPTSGDSRERNYLFEEFRRGRSVIRSELEFVKGERRFGISSYRRFLEQLDFFRRRVIRDQQLPAEVVGEISRNLGLMINEVQDSFSSKNYDEIQVEISMTNAIRYLRQLKEKLKETGFISEKSPISRELEDLLDLLD
jgi:energy-coupling factor transporter ATP-binding protein EcfA2